MKHLTHLLLLGLLASCMPKPNLESAREEIMEIHLKQRKFHVEEMPADFVGLMSDDFISVNRGVISTPSREDSQERFTRYFDLVEFEKWDDLSEPEIRFSDDGSMAYTIVHKEVVVKYQNDSSQWIRGRTEFSWLAVYKKTDQGWKVDAVASTNLPDEETVISD
ncbi:MAG: hypothetical protein ABJF11_19795 [Reichenbachiella sp.]|uniref:hypothetical protein n=1 Tax=Reichenbachiella sp. TaxID=2184521 RepID=UPI0032651FE9